VLRTVVLVLPPLNVVLRTEWLPILVIVEMLVTRPFLFLRTIVLDILLLLMKFAVAHGVSLVLITLDDTAYCACVYLTRTILIRWVAQGVSQ
jgi:hypothetical protein